MAKAKLAEAMRATTPLLVDLSPRSRRGDAETRRRGDANREGLDSQHSELRTQNRTQDAGRRTQDSLPPCVRLVKARHPLLTGNVVPITVELGADFDILVITGPNTGGKTVALKTVGLLCLMAQCGLQIPAEEGSSVGVFRSVYADIGDEQSIEQSLSTFSSHVTHIVDILDKADETSLVLLDELGAGTDTGRLRLGERSSHLLDRKVPTIATTHYSELKSFALHHSAGGKRLSGVRPGDFVSHLQAQHWLLVAVTPGHRNETGDEAEIIEEAKQMLQPTDLEIEGLLAQLQADREQARSARAEAES